MCYSNRYEIHYNQHLRIIKKFLKCYSRGHICICRVRVDGKSVLCKVCLTLVRCNESDICRCGIRVLGVCGYSDWRYQDHIITDRDRITSIVSGLTWSRVRRRICLPGIHDHRKFIDRRSAGNDILLDCISDIESLEHLRTGFAYCRGIDITQCNFQTWLSKIF